MNEKSAFCSNCGSLNVKPVYRMGSIDNRVECSDCGAIAIPLEGNEKFRKRFLEEKK